MIYLYGEHSVLEKITCPICGHHASAWHELEGNAYRQTEAFQCENCNWCENNHPYIIELELYE